MKTTRISTKKKKGQGKHTKQPKEQKGILWSFGEQTWAHRMEQTVPLNNMIPSVTRQSEPPALLPWMSPHKHGHGMARFWGRQWFGVKSLCLRSTQAWLWGLIHTKVDAKTTCLPCFCMTNQIFWILEWFTHQSSKIPSPSQVSRTKSINQTHHQNQTLVAKTSDQRYRGTSQWSQGHGG